MDKSNGMDLFDLENYNPNKLDTAIKKGFRTAAENIATIVISMVIIMIFARAFFDIEFKDFYRWATLGDVILIIVYSIVVQNTMGFQGGKNGKQDIEYKTARTEYTQMRDRIRAVGSPKLEEFCDHYINSELELARKGILSYTPIKYEVWVEHFSYLTPMQIKRLPKLYKYTDGERQKSIRLSHKTKLRLCWLYKMEPEDITPEKLMTEFANRTSRGGLPLSPEEALERENKRMTIQTIIMSAIMGIIAWKLIGHFSAEALMSALMTLFCVVCRGFVAYTKHYTAYSVRGPMFFNRQIEILSKYECWVREQSEKGAEADNILTTQDSLKTPF